MKSPFPSFLRRFSFVQQFRDNHLNMARLTNWDFFFWKVNNLGAPALRASDFDRFVFFLRNNHNPYAFTDSFVVNFNELGWKAQTVVKRPVTCSTPSHLWQRQPLVKRTVIYTLSVPYLFKILKRLKGFVRFFQAHGGQKGVDECHRCREGIHVGIGLAGSG